MTLDEAMQRPAKETHAIARSSIRRLIREMEADLDSPGPWSREAWIRAYGDRLEYLRKIAALFEKEAGRP